MVKNVLGLKGVDVAAKIAQKCFTQEQRAILEYQQGEINVTIADQLNLLYGDRYLMWDEDSTINAAAQVIHEYEYLITDLEQLKAKIVELKTPGSYKATTTTTAEAVGCTNTDTQTDSIEAHKSLNQLTVDNGRVGYVRNSGAEPDTLIESADIIDDSDKLKSLVAGKTEREFASDAFTKETLLTVTKQEKTLPTVKPKSDGYEYNIASFTKTGDLEHAVTDGSLDSRRKTQGNILAGGITTSNSVSGTEAEIRAESILKSLKVDIPRIRNNFGSKFSLLYTFCVPC